MNTCERTVALLAVCLVGWTGGIQSQTAYEPSRLPDGRPNLQGVWDFKTLTPLQRPDDLSDQDVFGLEEAAELESAAAARTAAANAPTSDRQLLPDSGSVAC